jgi:hypothetical protein
MKYGAEMGPGAKFHEDCVRNSKVVKRRECTHRGDPRDLKGGERSRVSSSGTRSVKKFHNCEDLRVDGRRVLKHISQ